VHSKLGTPEARSERDDLTSDIVRRIFIAFADGHMAFVRPTEINCGKNTTEGKFTGYSKF